MRGEISADHPPSGAEDRMTAPREVIVLGAGVCERIVEVKLAGEEKAMFENSVNAVRELMDACVKLDPSLG